jgi:hypothetical protein
MEKKEILTEETIDRCLGCMAREGTNSRIRELTPQKRPKSIKIMRYLLGRRAGSDTRHLVRPVYGGAKFQALLICGTMPGSDTDPMPRMYCGHTSQHRSVSRRDIGIHPLPSCFVFFRA